MSGAAICPAPSRGASIPWPRLAPALGIAVALHLALLALRPGGIAGSHVAPAAAAMAVRIVAAPTSVQSGRPSEPAPLEAASVPAVPRMSAPAVAPIEATRATRESSREPRPSLAEEPKQEQGPAVPPAAAMPSTAETALPAAPEYALGVRLDPGPRPLEDIEPDYPDPNLREGTVVIRILISETGHVDDVALVRSEPRGVFDQAALDAFGKAKFAPGMAGGVPVKSQITIEVRFVPINRGARVSGRTY